MLFFIRKSKLRKVLDDTEIEILEDILNYTKESDLESPLKFKKEYNKKLNEYNGSIRVINKVRDMLKEVL